MLDEPAPDDPAALVEDHEALRDAQNRLRQLLLLVTPDGFPAESGERAQAQAASQIIARLMETLDGMLA